MKRQREDKPEDDAKGEEAPSSPDSWNSMTVNVDSSQERDPHLSSPDSSPPTQVIPGMLGMAPTRSL
jgi:hypothetical protein